MQTLPQGFYDILSKPCVKVVTPAHEFECGKTLMVEVEGDLCWSTLAPACNSAQLELGAKVAPKTNLLLLFCFLFCFVSNHKYPASTLPRELKFRKQPLVTKTR